MDGCGVQIVVKAVSTFEAAFSFPLILLKSVVAIQLKFNLVYQDS